MIHIANKDKLIFCVDLFVGDNIVDGYWDGGKFKQVSKYNDAPMFHKNIAENELKKAKDWCAKQSDNLVPANYEVQAIPADEYFDLDY